MGILVRKKGITQEKLVFLILIAIILILFSIGIYELMKKMLRI